MRTGKKASWSIALACAIAATAPSARAQDDSAADTAAARKLGQEGLTLADAGNCQDAVDRLARSEKMHHAVSVLERLGECQVKLGKLVLGIETLRRVVREQLQADSPAAFVAAQERAQQIMADAKPRVARLKVAVAAPAGAAIWVTIDSVNEPTANLNSDRFVDPGDHVIEAGAPGYLKAMARLHLGEGVADSVALTLAPDPNAPPPAQATTPVAPAAGAPAAQTQARDHTAAYVAGGVGLVGIGFGVAFGLGAMSEKSSLDAACNGNVCPTSQQGTRDAGTRFGTISTVGFIVGGVGLATGAVLYFWDIGGSPQQERVAVGSTGLRVRAYVGPSSVGVSGSF